MSLLYPAFLLGLAALALPIVLHLIDRAMPRRIVFPTIRFIHQARQHRAGRKRIHDWFLLLARMTILAAIVFLFAGPLVRQPANPAVKDSLDTVLFVDLSLSMNAGDGADFLRTAIQTVMDRDPRARYALVASSNRAERVLPFGSSPEQIRDVVATLKPTLVPGNHHDALMELQKICAADPQARQKVVIISDLQQNDWSPSNLPRTELHAEIEFITPEHANQANLAILDVVPEQFVKGNEKRLRASVQLHNYSVAPRTAKLRLRSGAATAEQEVSIRGQYTETFVIDMDAPGADTVIAELLSDDALRLDDEFHLWVGPELPVNIAIIADPDAETSSVEAFFLENALSVSFPGDRRNAVSVVPPDYLWEHAIDGFDCIFLLDSIYTYGETELEALREFVRAGGTLVYCAGKKSADNVMKLHEAGLISSRFRGFQGAQMSRHRSFRLKTVADSSPLVSIFRDAPSDLFQFPLYKLVDLQTAADADRLLVAEGDYPFLVQNSLGSGVVFLFAVSLAPDWSEFSTSMVFVPLIHRVVDYSSGNRKRGVLRVVVGENAQAQLTAAGLPPEVKVEPVPGVQNLLGVPVEVNLTRAESDLRAVDECLVATHLTSAAPTANPVRATEQPSSVIQSSLRVPLAWALVAFACVELLAANIRRK